MKTLTLDTTGWSQDQKNNIVPILNMMIWQKQAIATKFDIYLPNVYMDNDEVDLDLYKQDEILATINQIIADREQATADAIAIENAKKAELENNEFNGLKLEEIADKVNATSDINDLKTLLVSLISYIKARE